ncbi:MAG TPA: hypothetical protein DIU44_01090 [Acholeplasmatales bacterium]|nr:hypothetical protein [Acholeplasmatales bacterium]
MSEFFSDKLKKLRLSKNLTQDQLAKLIYVSRSAVAKWEQNRGFPNIDALQRISKIFEVSIDDLLSDKELKILEVINNKKKISLQRKIIISLSILTAIILIAFISLTVIYHPRTISKYVKSNSNNNFVKIEIINYDEDIIVVEKSEADSFLNEILAIKVIPSYLFVQKVVSSYTVNLYYDDTVYQLNNYYIYDGKTRTYFNIVNGNIYDLVNKYTN